jgi:uncharacterized protein
MADWNKIESRGNVEDRRGVVGSVPVGALGTVGILLFIGISLFSSSGDPSQIGQLLEQLNSTTNSTGANTNDGYAIFASQVLGSANDYWKLQLRTLNYQYTQPKLVLFRTATQSGCGGASSDMGPHYCPVDTTVYLDETFFEVLTSRFGAKGGDVAQAYVIGHEVGHHIQHELGTSSKVRRLQAENPDRDNALSVRLELQADCYAGMWVRSIANQGIIEKSEFAQAVDAAQAVGDDRIQKKTSGSVDPETWTHGSSVERRQWLEKGYDATSIESCNTFR